MPYETVLDKPGLREITPYFLRIFLPLSAIFIIGTVIFYSIDIWYEEQIIRAEQSQQMTLSMESLQRDITGVIQELHYLAESQALNRYLSAPDNTSREFAETELETFARNAARYDQIRWLDLGGKERLRVDHRDGVTRIVPPQELQDKSSRYYFIEGIKLPPGKIYISPLDLNIEHGKIEIPYRPMLRLATPTRDQYGNKNGLVILNYQAQRILDNLARSKYLADVELYLLNRDGYWLYASDEHPEWGFMFGREERLANTYPLVWREMLQQQQGEAQTQEGIFRFASLDVGIFGVEEVMRGRGKQLDEAEELQQQETKWFIVTLFPHSAIRAINISHAGFYSGIVLFALLVVGAISWRLARGQEERERLTDRLALHAKVMETATNGVIITDTASRIIAVNKAFTALTGYTEEEVRGRTPALLASGRHEASFYQEMWNSLVKEGFWEGEIWNRHKSGELFPEWLSISAIYDHHGGLSNYIGIFSVLAEQKGTEERLRRLANTDMLTGLINRNLLYDRADQALAHCRRAKEKAAILFLDLDGFKPINDTIGHAAGDVVLKTVAGRIQQCMRESDTVARFGGDEFVVLLTGIDDRGHAKEVAQKLIRGVAEPIAVEGEVCQVGVSIGICLYPDDAASVDELLRCADQAMYQAKHHGRGRAEFYRER